ncbi:hypothetical protein SNOG_15226 [Parastagonospora nodorum SN15]|uniref:Uncharacterized protein n=1 Tax=Phaeosphaeria nodorum (strain SN15 / ATCC MYA-4574 / FGSC 10173) TaxID=321614 RepID=Q0TZ96_PHANO|nr:hypothetical protein SNOG_15226 [Parastagonospora nodorum SN15]EAT77451.1 hypothetical protein SNOG_15226 [Parastagonospora nodorum SN15]
MSEFIITGSAVDIIGETMPNSTIGNHVLLDGIVSCDFIQKIVAHNILQFGLLGRGGDYDHYIAARQDVIFYRPTEEHAPLFQAIQDVHAVYKIRTIENEFCSIDVAHLVPSSL